MEERLQFDRERFLKTFMEMVRIDSEYGFEGEMTAYLEKWFKDRGAEVKRDNAGSTCGSTGDNIIVHIPGTMPGEAICFNAHQDTVIPGKGIVPQLDGDVLTSAGETILAADDKSGVALLLEAYENICEKNIPHREMYYLFTIGEEFGQTGAHALDPKDVPCRSIMSIDDAGRPCNIDIKGPGCWLVNAEFTGRAAHPSVNPEDGISAVQMMAHAIANMPLGKIGNGVSANIGCASGGETAGGIPEFAKFSAIVYGSDFENPMRQIETMRTACEDAAKKFGGKVEFSSKERIPVYHQDEDWFVFKCCRDAYRKEGIEPKLTISGGAGDCNILIGKGYECGGIASGMYNCHALNEYLDLNDFALTYRIIMRMMTDGFEG